MLNSVNLCCVPGHMGIPCNEKANRLAKTGLSTPTLVPLCFPVQYFKPCITTFINQFWQLDWTQSIDSHVTQLFSIYPLLHHPMPTLPSRHANVYMRLMLGHMCYTHGHVLGGNKDMLSCPQCNAPTALNVPHLLFHCTELEPICRNYYICSDIATLSWHIPTLILLDFL